MYVLINNEIVINGPRPWNYRSFESSLSEELGIQYELPLQKTDDTPIEISSNVRILKAELIAQSYNNKIEYLHGPFWDFSSNIAIGTYQILEKDPQIVKNDLKLRLAYNRYFKEIAGVKAPIQNTLVTVDTRRGDRDIFLQKYSLMGDNDTVKWKFPEGWFILTKPELGIVVASAANYIQSQFNWEESVSAQIDAATTLQELDAIDIGDPSPLA